MRSAVWVVSLVVLVLSGCRSSDKDVVLDSGMLLDSDEDGYRTDDDCNDDDDSIFPGADESDCNGIDNDCDGDVDEEADVVAYLTDADGDGYPAQGTVVESCDGAPEGMVEAPADGGFDCNDGDQAVFPGADETCDGADNDCDGVTDEQDATDVVTFYADGDGDGYGDDLDMASACNQPVGYSAVGGDCDDADPAYHPGAAESDCTDANDYNCDGSVGYTDADFDGVPACEDCDDAVAASAPGLSETCDGVDNDCDGDIDENATDASTWYGDADGDGHGGTQFQLNACEAPVGYVASSDDCDDLDPVSYPGSSEVCDESDNDCDGDVDEGVEFTWYADVDGDGYGDAASTSSACTAPPGYSANGNDCDDTSASTSPAGLEVCDSTDNNCDGVVDEDGALGASTFYVDADGDGYGVSSGSVESCSAPTGYASVDGDCNDVASSGGASQHPGATEVWYDGIDQDCDGVDDDQDEDGSPQADDCDDTDAASTLVVDDADCDGVLTADDCDDTTAALLAAAGDVDCDGALTADDCDDADSSVLAIASDADCDGALTTDDCDDTDSSVLAIANDADCDGALTSDDCDDSDVNRTWCRTCNDILAAGLSTGDGDYTIDPVGGDPFLVTCDMTTDGGGWTEIAYTQDLAFVSHTTDGDNYEWLANDFTLELSTIRIQVIQSLSTEGKQRYVGICDDVIHYSYGSNDYSYAFGFRFLDGTETPFATSNYSPHAISVPQDGCSTNNADGNSLVSPYTGTFFDIDSPLVPVKNVYSRDNSSGEEFGSPLTAFPARLR